MVKDNLSPAWAALAVLKVVPTANHRCRPCPFALLTKVSKAKGERG